MESKFNLEENTLTTESGNCTILTEKEKAILTLLIKEKATVVSKSLIINRVWDSVKNYEDNLTQLIYRIREKLKVVDLDRFVFNERGIGYVFDKDNRINIIECDKKNFILINQLDEIFYETCRSKYNNELIIKLSDFDCIYTSVKQAYSVLSEISVILRRYNLMH